MTREQFYDQVVAMLDRELGDLDGTLDVGDVQHLNAAFAAIAGEALADHHSRAADLARAAKEPVHEY